MRVLWDIVTRRWIRGGVGNRLPKKYGKVLGMSGGFSVERLRTPWRLEFRRPARQGLRPNLLCRFPVFPPSAQSPGAPEQTPRPRGGAAGRQWRTTSRRPPGRARAFRSGGPGLLSINAADNVLHLATAVVRLSSRRGPPARVRASSATLSNVVTTKPTIPIGQMHSAGAVIAAS